MKKEFISFMILLGLIAGVYLLSPLFIQKELNEDSPLINDALDSMNEKTRQEFDNAVQNSQEIQTQEGMPSTAQVISQAEFKPRAHEVEGKALLIQEGENKIIRFEEFQTINGPNLHIYLASDLSSQDFIDLGPIKATKGNVNYNLPEGVDTEKYNKVLVWCVPFRVLFSYAEF